MWMISRRDAERRLVEMGMQPAEAAKAVAVNTLAATQQVDWDNRFLWRSALDAVLLTRKLEAQP